MYEHLQRAIADGLSVGFFSGNTCCGRIDPRPSSRGVPNRIYGRVDYFGPRDEGMIQRFPSMSPFPYRSPHESQLMGAVRRVHIHQNDSGQRRAELQQRPFEAIGGPHTHAVAALQTQCPQTRGATPRLRGRGLKHIAMQHV